MGLSKKFKVKWVGSQFINHSLALVNREICKRLIDENKYDVAVVPYEHDPEFKVADDLLPILERYTSDDETAEVTVKHQWPPHFSWPIHGRRVIFQPWEFGSIPRKWYIPMKYWVDQIWVYSNYNKESYVRSGLPAEKIKVIPLAVDDMLFRPTGPTFKLVTQKKFKFLFVGGSIYRKGIDTLISSYLKEFSAEDDVCLIIKDHGTDGSYKGQTYGDVIKKAQLDKSNPEIIYLNEDLSPTDLASLFRSCDCLVHPYRGEGFGLPIAEAMASGIPVIVPSMGPSLDICQEETTFFVRCKEKYFDKKIVGQLTTVDYPWLLEIDEEHFRHTMRFAFEHPQVVKDKGGKASQFILENFTWDQTLQHVHFELDNLLDHANKQADLLKDDLIILEETKLAVELYQKGSYSEALNILYCLIDVYPDDVDTLYNIAIILIESDDSQAAFEYLTRIAQRMELHPNEFKVDIWNLMGICLAKLEQNEKASKFFEAALQLAPDHAAVAENLTLALQAVQHQDMVSFDSIQSLYSVSQRVNLEEINKLNEEECIQYQKYCETLYPKQPNSVKIIYLLGLLNFKRGLLAPAIDCFRKVVEVFDAENESNYLLFYSYKYQGLAFQRMGNDFKAESSYIKALELDAEDADTLRHLEQVRDKINSARKYYLEPAEGTTNVKELFHKVAHGFEGSEDILRKRREKWLSYFVPGDKVLDIGCGNGFFMEMLNGVGVNTEGIDFDKEKVLQGRKKGLIIHEQPAEEFLTSRGSYYDGIFMGNIIEHIPPAELLKLLIECKNALSDHGKLIILTPNIGHPAIVENFWLDLTHVRPYPKVLLEKLMESLSLTVKESNTLEDGYEYYVVAQKSCYEVLWQSPIYNASGYAEEQKDFLESLRPLPIKIKLEPKEDQPKQELLSEESRRYLNSIQLNHLKKPIVHYQAGPAYQFTLPNAPLSVGRSMFETDTIPLPWVKKLNELTEIWVPSEFNRITFANAGVDQSRLYVMPEAIDTQKYDLNRIEPFPLKNVKTFKFVSVFDWSSRKGWDILVRAFIEEFSSKEDVSLILKVNKALNRNADPSKDILNLANSLGFKEFAHIQVIESYFSEEEMLGLYAACDSFVLPSRGEGWGRPYMEAMAMGLPVIGTRWSGNTEFMNDDNSYLIDIEGLVPVPSDMPSFYHGHHWAQPSVEHLKSLLREVYENREEAKQRGQFARSDLFSRFSKKIIGKKMHQRIKELVESYYD